MHVHKSLVFGIRYADFRFSTGAGPVRESPTAANSVEDINTSIVSQWLYSVVISKEESGNPGYAHAEVWLHLLLIASCSGARMVDYYGPPLDLNDRTSQQVEQRMCTEVAMDTRDG